MSDDSAQTLIDAGGALSGPHTLDDGGTYIVVPNGFKVVDLERYLESPARIVADVKCQTVESFIDYFDLFKSDSSMIFIDDHGPGVVGVIDYHGPRGEKTTSDPSHCSHEVSFVPPQSKEWQKWTGRDGIHMDQLSFAQFIEANHSNIEKPDAATILEISKNLEAKQTTNFKSSHRQEDGSREFHYETVVSGTTKKGKVKVPSSFELGVPVFLHGVNYKVIARLRFRIHNGNLELWFDLDEPHRVMEAAFEHVLEKITTAISNPTIHAKL